MNTYKQIISLIFMEKYSSFTLDIENNLKLRNYVEKISEIFGGNAKMNKTTEVNLKKENGYDRIILNQKILKKDFYLDVDFILGGYREYLKLDCSIFASTDKEINDSKKKLEEIIKN